MGSWCWQLIAISMLLFFLPVPVYSGALSTETRQLLTENIRAHDATILGERHRRPESKGLLVELADALTADGHCLAVGLEFDTDQNATLDSFMAGKEPVDAIVVSSIIDHPCFRRKLPQKVNTSKQGGESGTILQEMTIEAEHLSQAGD